MPLYGCIIHKIQSVTFVFMDSALLVVFSQNLNVQPYKKYILKGLNR